MKHVRLFAAAALAVALYTGATVTTASAARTLGQATPCLAAMAGGDLFSVYSKLTPAAYGRGFQQREPLDNGLAADLPASAKNQAGPGFAATVPVYFHVITDRTIGSLTSRQIAAQMNVFNDNFAGSGPASGSRSPESRGTTTRPGSTPAPVAPTSTR